MGTGHTAKKKGIRSKKKQYKRNVWLCNRDKDIDQIQDEFEKVMEQETIKKNGDGTITTEENDTTTITVNPGQVIAASIPFSDELPGFGQYYCAETARHFIDEKALADHKKTKFYKRRVKQLKEEKYTQHVAEWSAGMSKEILPPAHT